MKESLNQTTKRLQPMFAFVPDILPLFFGIQSVNGFIF